MNYPNWCCQDCGSKASDRQFEVSTWHIDKCDVCGEEKPVTEPRDFYYPEFPVDNRVARIPDDAIMK